MRNNDAIRAQRERETEKTESSICKFQQQLRKIDKLTSPIGSVETNSLVPINLGHDLTLARFTPLT